MMMDDRVFSLGRMDLVVYLKVCTITNMDLLVAVHWRRHSHESPVRWSWAASGMPAQVNSQFLVTLWHGGER